MFRWYGLIHCRRLGVKLKIWSFGQAMCGEYVEEKRDLIRAVPKDRKLSDIPKLTQVWSSFSICAWFTLN